MDRSGGGYAGGWSRGGGHRAPAGRNGELESAVVTPNGDVPTRRRRRGRRSGLVIKCFSSLYCMLV